MRRGATEYIPKPFTPAQVKLVVHKVFEMRRLKQKTAAPQKDQGRVNPGVDFLSSSFAMARYQGLSAHTEGKEQKTVGG
jgi:NtrC-family two-component system response regulator AlgB